MSGEGSGWPGVGVVLGLVGVAAGAVAAGAAVGAAVESYTVGRALRRSADPMQDEPFGSLRGAPIPVIANDGVHLHVEVDEPEAAEHGSEPITVVFCHGYALSQDSWHFQRRDLHDVGRLVFWDQRSHGRSGRSDAGHATLEQTGDDLGRVLDEVVPTGPLVLVGHSMGGMTIMSLAEQRPELFTERVRGVGLLATTASDATELPLGLEGLAGRMAGRLVPGLVQVVGRKSTLVDRGRRLSNELSLGVTKRYAFASDVPPSYVEWTLEMLNQTPMDVIAEFYPDLGRHQRHAALAAMRPLATLVMVGRDDKITPPAHTKAIADELPEARVVLLEHCGHMLQIEHHDVVTDAIRDLVERAVRPVRPVHSVRPAAGA